jgi:hypothetical protein
MRLSTFLVMFVAFSGAPATAPRGTLAGGGADAEAMVRHIFDAADRDDDGQLTQLEYDAAGLARFGVSFEDCDADGDGRTSLDEYLAVYRRHHPSDDHREV